MPSLVQQYEYDIFISYRHNDNLDGWVTEFVQSLEKELKATLKDSVSIYFDKNPHDGLLETHNVDKSLEGKLRSLIFIPIISQTYCDAKSFAWRHEFLPFNKQSQQDQFGRDIKLSSGNVSSRILPIKIHDLDAEDKALIESQLGGTLRAIEFTYKESGVNRPLKLTDNKADNQNKTDYGNQVNKVANAVKQIITALKNPTVANLQKAGKEQPEISLKKKRYLVPLIASILMVSVIGYFLYQKLIDATGKASIAEQSIAVLSFADMSPNKDQEYLGDGMAEEILNGLTKIKGLKVIGRTSSFSFKGKDTDLQTIGETLGASTILEGSIQKSGNKIRITAQLINAADEVHIWSERYESEEEDIFAIQDEIVTRIIQKLKGSMAIQEGATTIKPVTTNLQAYEMLLRARHFLAKGFEWQERALGYYQQAIALEPSLAQAYVELAEVYWNIGLVGLTDQKKSILKSKAAALKAVSIDETSYAAHNMLAFLSLTIDWDIPAYLRHHDKAVSLGLPLPDLYHAYYEQWILLEHDKVIKEAELRVEKDPLSVERLVELSRAYLYARRYDDLIRHGMKTLELAPDQSSIFRHVGEAYLFTGRPELALPYFERLMEKNPLYSPQNFVAVQIALGNRETALQKFNELKASISPGKKALCYIHLGEIDSAFAALNEASLARDPNVIVMQVDRHYDPVRNDPRYQAILRKIKGLE